MQISQQTAPENVKPSSLLEEGMKLAPKTFFVPSSLGEFKGIYHKKEFFLCGEGKVLQIARCNLVKELRGIEESHLREFLKKNYLSLKKVGEGYGIDIRLRGRGGGAFTFLSAVTGTTLIASYHFIRGERERANETIQAGVKIAVVSALIPGP